MRWRSSSWRRFIMVLPVSLPLTNLAAQGPEFEVVSIKRVDELRQSGGMRTLPDGTFVVTTQPMGSLVNVASPVPARDTVGMPDWMTRDRYEVTVKPPGGLTREQL